MAVKDITAEPVQVGGVMMAEPCGYRVIIDRISQDVPFYRAYLKNAVLTGTTVINNPFWWTADDKFFQLCTGIETRRCHSEDSRFAAQSAPAGHHFGKIAS